MNTKQFTDSEYTLLMDLLFQEQIKLTGLVKVSRDTPTLFKSYQEKLGTVFDLINDLSAMKPEWDV